MSGADAVLVGGLAGLPLTESQPENYDRPIGLRQLHQDPASGAEHYVVRYPAGLRARRHHHTAAHTIIVLDGQLGANGPTLGPARTAASRPVRWCTTPPPVVGRACS